MLRILDTTDQTSMFGPIFDSLAFPTSVQAGEPGTFALSVVAPGGDQVLYAWSSDCAESTAMAGATLPVAKRGARTVRVLLATAAGF